MIPAPGGRRCYVSVAYTHASTDPRIRRHCEAMSRRGWNVYQIGIAREGQTSVGRANGVVLVRWRRPRYRGARVARYVASYTGFWLWARRVMRRIERRRAIHVIQINNVPNWMVWLATGPRRRGTGVILDIHDPVPELFLSKFSERSGARLGAKVLEWEERLASHGADAVLCVHEPHRALTVAHGVAARKVLVFENLPDARLIPLRPPRHPCPFVGYHGTVAERMGLDVLLHAVRALRGEGQPLRGAIWGDGDAVDGLRRTRDALGLREEIDISGRRVPLEALVPRLEDVGVGIVLLRRDAFTDMMLPTKVLEYVRLGIPVVATWTPTMAHYFTDDAIQFVRDPSPVGVANALREVFRSPDRARARAAHAQTLPIARPWQEREPDFVQLVEEVAACRRRARR